MPIYTVEYRTRPRTAFGSPVRVTTNINSEELTPQELRIVEEWLKIHAEHLNGNAIRGALNDPPGYITLMTFELVMPRMDGREIVENGMVVRWLTLDSQITNSQIIDRIQAMTETFTKDCLSRYAEYDQALEHMTSVKDRGWGIDAIWTEGATPRRETILLTDDQLARIKVFKARQESNLRVLNLPIGPEFSAVYFSSPLFYLHTYTIEMPRSNYPDLYSGGVRKTLISVDLPRGTSPNEALLDDLIERTIQSWDEVVAHWPEWIETMKVEEAHYKVQEAEWELAEDKRFAEEAEQIAEKRLRWAAALIMRGEQIEGAVADAIIAASGLKPESRFPIKINMVSSMSGGQPSEAQFFLNYAQGRSTVTAMCETIFTVQGCFKNSKHKESTWKAAVLMQHDGSLSLIPDTTFRLRKWKTAAAPAIINIMNMIEDF